MNQESFSVYHYASQDAGVITGLIIKGWPKIGKPVTGRFEKPDSSTMISKP
jgi:hypothetical protein